MNKVGSDELCDERRNDVGKKDDSFRDCRTNKIESGREDNNIECVVYDTYSMMLVSNLTRRAPAYV